MKYFLKNQNYEILLENFVNNKISKYLQNSSVILEKFFRKYQNFNFFLKISKLELFFQKKKYKNFKKLFEKISKYYLKNLKIMKNFSLNFLIFKMLRKYSEMLIILSDL